jgi:HK97 family phage portal protein
MTGELSYAAIDPPLREQEFIAQRELSAREVARVMRVPAWAIDAPTGDSLTYANVAQQNRHLLDHSLRPWLVRIERAITNDSDLCPGSTYLSFDDTALTRLDADARYEKGLAGGWLTVEEIREREDLPPLGGRS